MMIANVKFEPERPENDRVQQHLVPFAATGYCSLWL